MAEEAYALLYASSVVHERDIPEFSQIDVIDIHADDEK